ncbi:uncharacterized protein LOC129238247 [Anastrepha obliqua]|uniref:uncharacterized protein LOC129238247 n=1 Tax=Anastrepha obliqua TaxID=95512 RepID=UPI002409BE0D|nr:uncharacterized protein LOC129238247 [Anastrepha obliqua]
MQYRIALIGLLATALFHLVENVEGTNLIVKVVTPEEMNKILEEYPDAVEMTATKTAIEGRSMHRQARSVTTYTLGTGRVSGDSLVSSESSTNDFDVATTVSANIRYPSTGTGAVVTYVKINVYQSNSDGRAYVTSGGIGSTHVAITIEAVKTYYFDLYTFVYGK